MLSHMVIRDYMVGIIRKGYMCPISTTKFRRPRAIKFSRFYRMVMRSCAVAKRMRGPIVM